MSPSKPNVIVSYGGRYQPVHMGHKGVYDALVKKFGKANVYVTTSNKVDRERSPLSFQWKKKLLNGTGIPSNKILQVKNNYNADDILKSAGFKPENTIWITAVGEKDGGRLGGKFFTPYKEGKPLTTADKHGYVYIIPNIKMAGKVMSATSVRSILRKDGELDKSDYIQLKKSTGMNRATVDQVRPLFEHYVQTTGLLTEGGFAGHMWKIFEDLDLKFSDIEDMISAVLSGEINREEISEKVDGQNLFASIKNGRIVLARNKTQIKNQGAKSLNADGISELFKDKPSVKKAFLSAIEGLESSLLQMSKDDILDLFDEGRNWMNIEIITPKNKNVFLYDSSDMIVLHNLNIVNDDGVNVGGDSAKQKKLFSIVKNLKPGTMTVKTPIMMSVKPHEDFSKMKSHFIGQLTKYRSSQKVGKSATLGSWMEKYFSKKIATIESKYNHKIESKLRKKIVHRFGWDDKSLKMTTIRKEIGFLPVYNELAKLNKNVVNEYKIARAPLEKLIMELGVEVLSNLETYLSANPSDTVATLRRDIDAKISQLKKSNNPEDLKKMRDSLKKIAASGGLDKLVPTEGIVFTWNGKTYKMTGQFSPIGGLLGLGRFK